MTTKPQYKFKVGDRVAERPKAHATFATRPESIAIVRKYRSQRYGTVVDIKHKRARDKRVMRYLVIKWDHLNSPMEHMQSRICPIENFSQIMNEICSTIEA